MQATKGDKRPDPNELLERAQAEESRAKRGRLKIFIGMAAGVGKTYTMLEEARQLKSNGTDVVVGYVEPHGRADTERLLQGLEVVPTKPIDYRGATLREFDIDAALARQPALILLDELAHTNAEGSRHPKRWQDALELLDAGMDVYTTVNVQHIESLNDVVAQITGVIVRETVPDSVIENAAQIELIDLTPEELRQRLLAGKVYKPQQVEGALHGFFRQGNLTALRELALRATAQRVNLEVQDYRHEHRIENTWPTAERLLVCIGTTSDAPKLVRAAHRMAQSLRADWIAVFVDTGARLDDATRERTMQSLRLAEQLGADTTTLSGTDVSEEVLNYARRKNISKIVVGKPERPRWREFLFGSKVNDLVRNSGLIDVYVIHGEHDDSQPILPPAMLERTSDWRKYALALVVCAVCLSLAALNEIYIGAEANTVMVFLLGVVIVAFRIGRGPALMAAVVSVLLFDLFFVEPRGAFAVTDTRYLITFGVMIIVGVSIGALAGRVRKQAEMARAREQRTAELYEMSREFANTRGLNTLAQIAERHIGSVFDSDATVLLPGNDNKLERGARQREGELPESEFGVAQWAFEHGQSAGLGTSTLAGADALHMPLTASRGVIGVLRVKPKIAGADQLQAPDQRHTLETFANQTALALERAKLGDEAREARAKMEAERTRNSLLSSVSHDLRTPLATIAGAASSLLESNGASAISDATRAELTQSIYDEAERLDRLVNNLLEMTRLQSGAAKVRKEWLPLEEVVGSALHRMTRKLESRPVRVDVPDDLPLAPFDGVLIEQVLMNLLDNAVKYSPSGSAIDIAAEQRNAEMIVTVADRGPGLPEGEEERIFDKFYRVMPASTTQDAVAGTGLGLAICRGIVEAHGGRIWAGNRDGGGTVFRFSLPIEGDPPEAPRMIEQVTA